jgi:hypothetical protein
VITIPIFVLPQDLYLLMTQKEYTHIRIYQADTEGGNFAEITTTATRIPLKIGDTMYQFVVDQEEDAKWYKYSFGNDVDESVLSPAFQRQLGDPSKVGYTFKNYMAPLGTFGDVLTPDDMRYTYLWGIDAVSTDSQYSTWLDEQHQAFVRSAAEDFEKYLNIDIYRRKYKTKPVSGVDRRAQFWMAGDDYLYTDEEFPYDYDPDQWQNFGFLQLRHRPVIEVSRFILVGPTEGSILDLMEWARLQKDLGQLHAFPRNQMIYGPLLGAYGTILLWQMKRYPQGIEIDYETGYDSADKVDAGLRDMIGKWAAVKLLNVIGDGLLPGFASQSVSLDGLSESFSSTQSATNAYFGARIMQYKKDIEEWLQRNKYKYGGIPIGFVTGG